MKTILAANFKGLSQLPFFGRDPGYLKSLGNMRVKPGGYLEMRGGVTRLKPVGGSAVNPTSTAGAGYLGAVDSSAPWGWVRMFDNAGTAFASYPGNLAIQSYIRFGNGTVGERLLIGADAPFSSVTFAVTQAGTGTFSYSYGTADGTPATYTALTTTTTPDFVTAVAVVGEIREETLSFAMPTNWVPTTEGSVADGYSFKYFVEIERTGAPGTSPYFGHQNIRSDWQGMKELFISHGIPTASAQNGIVSRYANNVTAAVWTSIGTSLFSGNSPRYRFVSYHGTLYFVNGKDEKRWDGSVLYDMGLPAPTQAFTIADAGATAGTWTGLGATLQFRYAFTYGYGSQQVTVPNDASGGGGTMSEKSKVYAPTLYGESPPCSRTVVAYPAGADRITIADANSVDISIAVAPPANVDIIYVYRTDDLTTVPASAVDSMPYTYLLTIRRMPTGAWRTGAGFFLDKSIAFPTPKKEMDQEITTPPVGAKNIWVSKNRAFLANSKQYPARVWWSRPYVLDAFDTDFNYEDFGTTIGGQVVGGCDFMNQSIVFTEDQMFGIADVDVDQFQSYPISPGIGCIAPDTICTGPGVLLWAARDGIYLWDGKGPLQKISHELDPTFQKMSLESHGWSRAIIHNDQYEIFLQSRNGAAPQDGYRFDLITNTWSSVGYGVTPDLMPFATITAPLGTNDFGVRHPLLAPAPVLGSSNWNIYIGELGTSDDGSSIGPNASIHFGPSGAKLMSPDRALFYYNAPNGWTNIQFFLSIPDVVQIGYDYVPADIATSSSIGGGDYTVVQCLFKPRATGSQDIVLTFTADSVDGQTLWGQRLMAAFLEGDVVDMKRPA